MMKADTQALQKFMANMPTDEDELAKLQQQHRQILEENRNKVKERKKRNQRLIQHCAIFEKFFPQTADMDQEQFYEFTLNLCNRLDI